LPSESIFGAANDTDGNSKSKIQNSKINRRPKHGQRLLADYAMRVGGKADAVGLKFKIDTGRFCGVAAFGERRFCDG